MRLMVDEIESPLGTIRVVTESGIVCAVDYDDCHERMTRLLRNHYGLFEMIPSSMMSDAAIRLRAFFDGDVGAIESVKVSTNGTAFQKQVWSVLRSIPLGTTATYAWVANQIGNPKACRAVGLANGANPISVIVPCHRVIGANTKLVGYAGGLPRKEWLLHHEMFVHVTN